MFNTLFKMTACVWCLAGHQTGYPLCEACIEKLPWIKQPCKGCALPLSEGRLERCRPCELLPLPYEGVKALFEYTWPCDEFIAQIKFRKKLEWIHLLGHLMAQAWGHLDERPMCLIPVPLHETRLKARGFNQAYLLAKVIGKALNIPVVWKGIYKTHATPPQVSLSHEERAVNLKQAFFIKTDLPLAYLSKVAIIDDVMTTGSTVSHLTLALKAKGVQHVDIWCCCRTLKPKISQRSSLLRPIL